MYSHGTLKTAQEVDPKAATFINSLRIGTTLVSEFPGDCGALCLNGANSTTKTDLENLMEITSRTGHNKLFATLVGKDITTRKQANMFVDLGWTIINDAKSNRNPQKTDIVLFYFNPNCKKKGY